MPPDPAPVLFERGAVVVVVVFLCFRFEPELGAFPPARGAAAFEPTEVDDDGAGCWMISQLVGDFAKKRKSISFSSLILMNSTSLTILID